VGLLPEVEGTRAFTALIKALVDAFNEKADPQAKLTELSADINHRDAFGDHDEIERQLMLALASVVALRKTPEREM
jgi:hypothetical protein